VNEECSSNKQWLDEAASPHRIGNSVSEEFSFGNVPDEVASTNESLVYRSNFSLTNPQVD